MTEAAPNNTNTRSNGNLGIINLANVNSNSSSNESAEFVNNNNADKIGGELSHNHTSNANLDLIRYFFFSFSVYISTDAKNEIDQIVDNKSTEESKWAHATILS